MATISCHHAKGALRSAQRRGIDANTLLIRAGINPLTVDIAGARIDEQQMTRLVQLVWEALDDEFMGFTATPCKHGAFAFMMHAIHHCDTLYDALMTGMQFYNLFTDDIQTRLLIDEEEAIIDIVFDKPELDPDYFFLEFWMVIWHRMASWITDTRIPLLQTSFAHPAPAHSAELQLMFPSPQLYEQQSNQMRFPATALKLPLTRDAQAIEGFLHTSPLHLLTIPGVDKSLRNQISRLIQQHSNSELSFPAIQNMAATLGLSTQTLHRRLQKENTSYQEIKDEIRRDIAMVKLVRDKTPVNEVANL
ncbi:MAG: AraC family transcriptional regulator ligand-binding domain-containing protein, partial [Pseudomonadales bacterium]